MPVSGLSGKTDVHVTCAGMRCAAGITGPLIRSRDDVSRGRHTRARSITCCRSATLNFLRECGPLGASVSGGGPLRPLAHPANKVPSTAIASANRRIIPGIVATSLQCGLCHRAHPEPRVPKGSSGSKGARGLVLSGFQRFESRNPLGVILQRKVMRRPFVGPTLVEFRDLIRDVLQALLVPFA